MLLALGEPDDERARELGLTSTSTVAPLEELEAHEEGLVAEMLRATPVALRLTKEALGLAIDAQSLEAVVALEDRNQILCVQNDDLREGVSAFLEKREPRYSCAGEQP